MAGAPTWKTAAARLGVAAVLGLGLVACGGSDDGDEGATETTGTETTAAETTTTEPPAPITVLVSNDDGYSAEGIDVLVTALEGIDGVEVVVVAPLEQRSGSGGTYTDGEVATSEVETISGGEATAVDGYPADSVRVAIEDLGIEPDLVVTGINEGQNIGPIVDLSGTVGAARQAVAHGVPALAVSGGSGADFGQEGYEDVDYEAAVPIVVQWVEMRLESIRDGSLAVEVSNLNVPTCATGGQVRGLLELEVAPEGPALDGQDCTSTLEDPPDDVTAFVNGFATLTVLPDEPANPPEAVVPGDS
ncbi:MAG: survival protein SurE [Acidimicrobiales bacterium]|nr:survival protein SurE [Acidimicrobiales bacterium]